MAELSNKIISEMIHYRSLGETIAATARFLGIAPWLVSYRTRFLKMCITHEEFRYWSQMAEHHGFGSVGEFIADVVNTSYEKHYVPFVERRAKREAAKKRSARKQGKKKAA
jgi:hypothetical protein